MKTTVKGLSSRALLVSVTISQWTGRKKDRTATESANTAHHAESTAGAYHKRLLPGAKELQAIQTLGSRIREYFYAQTLPWMSDGTRIISSKNYLAFTTKLAEYKSEYAQAVAEFERAYPALQARAVKSLGSLYRAEEYPEASEISKRFGIEVSFLPVPDAKDFRVQVSENEREEFERKMKEVEDKAMRECWTRLSGVVRTAAAKLNQPGAIFRDTLIENIQDVVNALPSLSLIHI